MRCLPLLATIVLATPLLAQAQNRLGIYPDQCGFCANPGEVSTSNITVFWGPGLNADQLTQYDPMSWRGVGQTRQTPASPIAGALTGAIYTVQDDNGSTPEPYTIIMVSDDGTGRPNADVSTGRIFSAPNMTPTATSTAGVVWTLTDVYATPFTGIPQEEPFYFGINFTATSSAALPPGDGLTVWSSTYQDPTPMSPYPVHANPRTDAPNLSWFIDRTTATSTPQAVQIPTKLVQNIFMLTDGPSLQTGADIEQSQRSQGFFGGQMIVAPNPSFGPAGIFPDTSGRLDGTSLFLRDGANPNSPSALWISAGFTPFPPISFPFTDGAVYLDPVTLIVFPSLTDPNGEVNFTLLPQGSAVINRLAQAGGGTLTYQFLTLTQQATLSVSNGVSVDYR